MKVLAISLACSAVLLLGCVKATLDVPEACADNQVAFTTPIAVQIAGLIPKVTFSSTVTIDLPALRDLQKYGSLELQFKEGALHFDPGRLASLERLEASVQFPDTDPSTATSVMSYVLPDEVRRGSYVDLGSSMDTATVLTYLQAGPIQINYKATVTGTAWNASQLAQSRICVSAQMQLQRSL
jgi:hypothetical protein